MRSIAIGPNPSFQWVWSYPLYHWEMQNYVPYTFPSSLWTVWLPPHAISPSRTHPEPNSSPHSDVPNQGICGTIVGISDLLLDCPCNCNPQYSIPSTATTSVDPKISIILFAFPSSPLSTTSSEIDYSPLFVSLPPSSQLHYRSASSPPSN